jgi:tetratricopeptide (TPR) repeat protein
MYVRIAIVVLLASAILGERAAAQDTAESPALAEARQRFAMAEELFARRDFASALREWERCYALMEGHPRRYYVLFNMGRALEELGRNREAIDAYERFLADAPADADHRADAQQNLNELRLRLQLEGGFSPSPIGLAIGGVGAAAIVAGAILGGIALAQDGDARRDCEGTRCTADAHAAIGEAGTFASVADVLLFGGLAVLSAGVVLAIVLAEGGDASASAMCTHQGCGAVVRGRF